MLYHLILCNFFEDSQNNFVFEIIVEHNALIFNI